MISLAPLTLVLLLAAAFLIGTVLGGISILAGLIAERWVSGRPLPRPFRRPPTPSISPEAGEGMPGLPRRGFFL